MPIITSIKPQRNKKRVNIYLDGKFGFGLDLDNLATLNLRVGTEFTEEEIKKIIKKAEFQKVYEKIIRYATLRPRSEKEINDWLRKHKVHRSLFKDLFKRLKRLDLLGDTKFAKWWVEQRTEFRPRGKRLLAAELHQKGIASDLINQLVNESISQKDEKKMAKELLEKKKYKWGKLPNLEARKKMNEFLARKGFGWEIIKKAIDGFFEKD